MVRNRGGGCGGLAYVIGAPSYRLPPRPLPAWPQAAPIGGRTAGTGPCCLRGGSSVISRPRRPESPLVAGWLLGAPGSKTGSA